MAKSALQHPSSGGEPHAVVVGAILVLVSAYVGAATGHRAGEVERRGETVLASSPDSSQTHELGLGRDAPAPDAAAPGDLAPYDACPSVASSASSPMACPPACGARSTTLSLSIEASAWWDSRPQ
jgi:hypothetical protein